ncbi:Hypothetical protein R9X50_00481300 [Acrodontium crateriforme]|uniref:Protein kinase domain-containing protein n=1 Tax=Acrodontium crateriforme TaxID=150365 RepID=A0AAQ3M601_9PEZI|nr:Hypothetical protein R9X50_00481300 [Acrodontium crateriforme]
MVFLNFVTIRNIARSIVRSRYTLHHRPYHCSMAKAKDALYCEIDAEPLSRYRKGGYHPVHLGDQLKSGRYQILHKLGWGGYATVWLAKDNQLDRSVAIKIMVSELGPEHQEASIYQRLSHGPASHPGRRYIPELFDHFELYGPNGVHHCLVLELLGAAATSVAENFATSRLPGRLAWDVARQVVQAVAYMHGVDVVHGDLHPGNIVFVDESISGKPHEDIIRSMGPPTTGGIHGQTLTNHIPRYLVLPSPLPLSSTKSDQCAIKIIDFGSAFLSGNRSPKMRCPLPYRAPEAVLTARWGIKADIWCLGCTIFALIVGYPPFDSFLFTENELARQWIATFGKLPPEWESEFISVDLEPSDVETTDFSEWLCETYLDDDKPPFFSKTDLQAISVMLRPLFRFLPSDRPSAEEVLLDPLFRNQAFDKR